MPLLRSTALVLCLLSSLAYAATEARELFQQGTRAFDNENYSQARTYFERAREAGLDTPALTYNLGVTYYRLKRFALAARAFRRLENDADWRPLALYNLGLVARKQGDSGAARQYFRQARASGEGKVARLARNALRRDEADESGGRVYLSLALGRDSNITLSPDDLNTTDRADTFMEAYVLGEQDLGENAHINASAYVRRYRDSSRFNDTGFEVEAARHHGRGGWRAETGARLSPFFLDGESFQTRYSVFSEWRRSLPGDQNLRIMVDGARIEGANFYNYLDGWRARLRARWFRPVGPAGLSLRYGFELHDRADLDDGNDFYSYSPRRNRIEAVLSAKPGPDWTLRGGVRYEHSRYADPHRLNGEETLRRDNRFDLSARMLRDLDADWRLYGEVSQEHQRSTLNSHDYDRNLIRIGLEYQTF